MGILHRITAVLKVKTDIITSVAVSLTGRVLILAIMYIEIYKTDIIVFKVIKCLTSH